MADGNGSSRRRSLLTHWVPLAVTVAAATAGMAVWVWSQRSADDDSEEHDDGLDYGAADAPSSRGAPGAGTAPGPEEAPAGPSWGARVTERLRRTPSPQQVLGSAGKTVAAGMAAAGAAVGTALSSIREEDKAAFADHETWSEEAEKQERATSAVSRDSGRGRRSVAIVVSADANVEDGDDFEHASILSHIPKNVDHASTKLFILIYAPGLKDSAQEDTTAQAGEESKSPVLKAAASGNPAFNAMYSQALSLHPRLFRRSTYTQLQSILQASLRSSS